MFYNFQPSFSQVNCISGGIARLKASNYLQYPFNTVLRQIMAWASCPLKDGRDTYTCSIPNKGLHTSPDFQYYWM
ncbi:hypothetical protein H6G91_39000 [Nostoc muscorum FACHB-395]|nr:hypothetical protein [Desmonostoc muscorum FACHB-395]